MRTCNFRLSYNVNLFNFVDSLSRWDYFVGRHVGTYFEKYYRLNSEDREILANYVKARKPLGWGAEMELFDWAFKDFPSHGQFNQLLNALRHFEQKQDQNGMLLKAELENATERLEAVIVQIERNFRNLKVGETVKKFGPLFHSPNRSGVLPCYITYTPYKDSSQGGANGDGIYTQVSIDLPTSVQVKQAGAVLAHEYMHKELNPGRYFKALGGIYLQSFPHLYPDNYYQFTEEVIVYSLNDVLTFDVDPEQKRTHYASKYADDPANKTHFAALWQTVGEVAPILAKFKDQQASITDTQNQLEEFFRTLVA